MPASVAAFGAQHLRGMVEHFFKGRARHAGLHRDGLVGLVKAHHLVHVHAHINGHAAFDGFHAAGNGGAAAKYVHGDAFFITVGHQRFDLFLVARGHHHVGNILHNVFAQTQRIDHAAAV
ncbi:hypothetical protein SDC9_99633 [bioreactor metagenome]|uniref:Uncharacterized protein n=1 Tax=bioreactor metagenome TaxID=1076179 RepID=A0A645AI70_9ZZZZ